jgi:NADPH:quinone reductase-like Zn-dependent oxidoreductase
MGSMFTNPDKDLYNSLLALIENGSVKPVIDRQYPLEQVPEALQYFGDGHVKGKIVINVVQDDKT